MTLVVARRDSHLPGVARLRIMRRLSLVIVVAVLVVQTYPIIWIFLSSLRPPQDFAASNGFDLPRSLTLDNFARAFEQGDLPLHFMNSLIVAAASIVIIVVLAMCTAYAIQVLKFRGSRLVLGLFSAGIIVPVQVALIPLFIVYSQLGFLDTYPAMIVPMVGFALPMSVYLFVSFYQFMSHEIFEAAVLDGCGPFSAFTRIVLPLSWNTIVTVTFVNAIFIWNDFIFANTFVFSKELKTIPLGLQDYIGSMGATDWTATFAAVAVTTTPILLLFLVLNRAIIYGLESGATKG
jgi:raffinose/stachyose/melibiose transport system permease protein